jgi:hypothetical protein
MCHALTRQNVPCQTFRNTPLCEKKARRAIPFKLRKQPGLHNLPQSLTAQKQMYTTAHFLGSTAKRFFDLSDLSHYRFP